MPDNLLVDMCAKRSLQSCRANEENVMCLDSVAGFAQRPRMYAQTPWMSEMGSASETGDRIMKVAFLLGDETSALVPDISVGYEPFGASDLDGLCAVEHVDVVIADPTTGDGFSIDTAMRIVDRFGHRAFVLLITSSSFDLEQMAATFADKPSVAVFGTSRVTPEDLAVIISGFSRVTQLRSGPRRI